MDNEIVAYYLAQHPRDSTRILESASPADLRAFIDALPLDERAQVVGNLVATTAATYLDRLAPEDAAKILERLRGTVSAQILGMLPQSLRQPVLDALPVTTQSTVRHLLRYPDDSVGALMVTKTLMCRMDANVRRAKQIVRRLADIDVPIMVVVDDEMKPAGLITVGKLLAIREREPIKDHMHSIHSRLRAYADVRTVLHLSAWQTEDYLPVVEAADRYVGLLPKARLHAYALATRGSARDDDDLTRAALDVADMVWGPAAEMLARLSTHPTKENSE